MTKLVDQSGSLIASCPGFRAKLLFASTENRTLDRWMSQLRFFFSGWFLWRVWPKTRQGSVHDVQLLGIADIPLCLWHAFSCLCTFSCGIESSWNGMVHHPGHPWHQLLPVDLSDCLYIYWLRLERWDGDSWRTSPATRIPSIYWFLRFASEMVKKPHFEVRCMGKWREYEPKFIGL